MENLEAINIVIDYILESEMEGREDISDPWFSIYSNLKDLRDKIVDEKPLTIGDRYKKMKNERRRSIVNINKSEYYCEYCFKDNLKQYVESDYRGGYIFCDNICETRYRKENDNV